MFIDKSEKHKKLVALNMRTRFFLLITALFFAVNMQAQSNFIRTFDSFNSNFSELMTSDDGNFIVLFNHSVDSMAYPTYPEIWKVDASGEPLWKIEFTEDTSGYLFYLFKLEDGTFLVRRSSYIENSIIHFNSDGEILTTYPFTLTGSFGPQHKGWFPNGDFLIIESDTYVLGDTEYEVNTMRITPEMDTVWVFEREVIHSINADPRVFMLDDGFLEVWYDHTYIWADIDSFQMHNYVEKYNFDGELLWSRMDTDTYTVKVIPDGSGGYYSIEGYQYLSHSSDDYLSLGLKHFNADGELLFAEFHPDLINEYSVGFYKHSGGLDILSQWGGGGWMNDSLIQFHRFDNAGILLETVNLGLITLTPIRKTTRTLDGGYLITASFKLNEIGSESLPMLIGIDSLGSLGYSVVSGKTYMDVDESGTYNTGDIILKDRYVKTDSLDYWAVSNYEGNYKFFIYDSAAVQLQTVPDSIEYYTIEPYLGYELFPNLESDSINNNDFRFIADTFLVDLQTELVLSGAHPVFGASGYISVYNAGTLPATNVYVKLYNDTLYQSFEYGSPEYEEFNSDFTLWIIDTIQVLSGTGPSFQILIPTDWTLLGDTIHARSEVWCDIIDYTPLNNTDTTFKLVTSSYDPNQITAEPAGETEWGYVDPETKQLVYLIEFQNNGNDTADLVVVIDTLPKEIIPGEILILGSSHSYTLQIEEPGILKWTFNNIQLVDSATNEAESKGYVLYKANLIDSLPLGTRFGNTAFIYFDVNPPIITNTAYTTLDEYIPLPIDNDLANASFRIYPNPASDFVFLETDVANWYSMSNFQGQLIQEGSLQQGLNRIDLKNVGQGLYTIQLINEKNTEGDWLYIFK